MKDENENIKKDKEEIDNENTKIFNDSNLLNSINIDDLTHFNDGTILNIKEEETSSNNKMLDILKEDINEFIKNKKDTKDNRDTKFTLKTENDNFGEMDFKNTNININGREASHIMQNTNLGQKLMHLLSKSQTSSLNLFKKNGIDTKYENLKYKEKLIKIEFEKKMRRIKKIRSKSHKKLRQRANSAVEKMELMNKCEDLSDSVENSSNCEDSEDRVDEEEVEREDEGLLNPVVSFQNERDIENKTLINEAFNIKNEKEDNEKEEDSFENEKNEIQISNGAKVNIKVIPGLNVWGGEGIVTKRTARNTIKEYSEGIVKLEERKDFNKSNIIINEEIEVNSKYKTKTKNNDFKFNDKIKMNYNEIKKCIKEQTPIGKDIGVRKYIEK